MKRDEAEMLARAELEQQLHQVLLTGEQAVAYQEFAAAAQQLEGLFKQYNEAKERYNVALAKLSRTANASG